MAICYHCNGSGRCAGATCTSRARRASVSVLALVASGVLLTGPAAAQTAAWTGNTSSDWFVSGNWNPAAVPGATTDVTINNGGLAMIGAAGAVARNVRLGDNAGQSGTLNVAGGALSGVGTLTLGDFGSGVLDISGAGTVTAGSVFAGLDPGGSGTATVSGAGSKLTASLLFYAGMDAGARGQFTILNGATLTTGTTVLGYYDATATGTLTVTGATIGTGTLTIGERGIGTFNLNGGSTGTSGSVTLGSNASGNGTANIAGSGTTWATRGINIGGTGRGTLTISDGAKATSTQSSSLAAPALVGGTATVTGPTTPIPTERRSPTAGSNSETAAPRVR